MYIASSLVDLEPRFTAFHAVPTLPCPGDAKGWHQVLKQEIKRGG